MNTKIIQKLYQRAIYCRVFVRLIEYYAKKEPSCRVVINKRVLKLSVFPKKNYSSFWVASYSFSNLS